MEQKTEASQAVGEHKPCPFCGTAPRYLAKQEGIYCELVICDTCGLGLAPSSWNRRAALKARPVPTIAAKPVKYEQRFVSPQGRAAVWHDAPAETFHRHRSNGDLGDGWVHEVRALYAGQPAPTEAPNFCARCGKRLHAGSIHTCTPPGATEAAQGGFLVRVTPMNPEYVDVHPELALEDVLRVNPYGWPDGFQFEVVAAQSNTSNNSSSSQLSGNSGELQPSENTGELAQGEDSARLDAIPMWEYYGCTEAEWVEFKAWSKNRARASAETGGVKP